jgi:hypothetical protein
MAVGLSAPSVSADELGTYRDAVRQAHAIVVEGQRTHDPAAGETAARALAGPVGDSQPEILADLRRQPPDLADAGIRLAALEDALGSPGDTADPAAAGRELHRILAMPRYNAMRASPSPLDEAVAWLLQRLYEFLSSLRLGAGGRGLVVVLLAAAALAIIVIAALVIRDARARRQRLAGRARTAREVAADRFAEADRRAAAGDYVGALRALAGGVSSALGGEGAWEASPLTVREIFRRADRPEALRPLLLPFEAAVYGHRSPDERVYAGAAEAAAPFRQRGEP